MHDEMWTEVLLRYPGLTVLESMVKGPVKVQGKWYYLHMRCPHFPLLQDLRLEVQQQHKMKNLTTATAALDQRPGWTIFDLIENLPKFIATESPSEAAVAPPLTDAPQTNIYADIAALYAPQSYTIQLNDACSRIRFEKFAHHEQHYLELELPSLRLGEHSLPDGLPWQQLLQSGGSLTALLQQFQKYLEELRPFYDNFADIDELCHVVQPAPPPSTKANWRLFVLRERVFLKLLIADPFAPIASMSVHIIGPTHEVERLRRTFSDGLRDWDADLDIHKNLLRIFDLCFFPMPPGSGSLSTFPTGDEQQFCNICYCYQLEQGEIPIISCDNPHCSLIYHAACLKEWFNTLADGKDFLSVSFGACPFCKTKLSTSFAELLEN